MKISAVTMGQLEDFFGTVASKYTRKNYVYGIKKFEDWYGNSITKLVSLQMLLRPLRSLS